jgi:hypothetical protein
VHVYTDINMDKITDETTVIRISSEPATVQFMIDQEHIKCSGSMITNAARCTRETKSMIVMAKGEFSGTTVE